jgi:hypothetical protein
MDGTSTPEGRTGLGLPAEPPGTPRRAITGFLALARFLLAESPGRAEQFSGDVPELRRIIERDRGVIRYPEPSGPMYISVRDGLRTTSADPPAWADPAEIIDLPERPPPGQVLLARLRAAADGIRALDRDRHATYRVPIRSGPSRSATATCSPRTRPAAWRRSPPSRSWTPAPAEARAWTASAVSPITSWRATRT